MTGDVTRFAPSPTGYLHLGHAFAALTAAELARASRGRFLVRIEDTDRTRARPAFEAAIDEDLTWLGLSWERPVRRQSEHFDDYARALEQLKALGCTYPCFCTRKDIEAEFAASVSAPHGPDGPIYPGLCKSIAPSERDERIARGDPCAWRLDVEAARAVVGKPIVFEELGSGPSGERGTIAAQVGAFGDFVLARKDAPASYHLSAVVDDALQGITLVTRGNDLFASTSLHRLLQELLSLPAPRYSHHRLITDAQGKRLAKRDEATTLRTLRAKGVRPEEIRTQLGFTSR